MAGARTASKLVVYSYGTVPHIYHLSPFALKLESWLRLNNLPYELRSTMTAGPKGKLPYVQFEDGERLGDSNVIIARLKEKCGSDCDAGLTREQRAVAQTVTRMVEEHTIQIIFWWRYCPHIRVLARTVQVRERILPFGGCLAGLFMKFWIWGLPKQFGNKFGKRGLAAHSEEELVGFSNDDLRAISDLMGEGPFFFGERATTIDCTLFGHLANFLLLPMDFPQTAFVRKECPNLLHFMDRFREDFYPDWEERCATPNNR